MREEEEHDEHDQGQVDRQKEDPRRRFDGAEDVSRIFGSATSRSKQKQGHSQPSQPAGLCNKMPLYKEHKGTPSYVLCIENHSPEALVSDSVHQGRPGLHGHGDIQLVA